MCLPGVCGALLALMDLEEPPPRDHKVRRLRGGMKGRWNAGRDQEGGILASLLDWASTPFIPTYR